jgi:hypothetical protein
MPTKKLTVEQETQIGLIIDMLERLEGKVDIAEAARKEREQNESAMLMKLDHTVFGNAKRGLVKDMQSALEKITLGIWLFIGIFSIVIADFVKHYLP